MSNEVSQLSSQMQQLFIQMNDKQNSEVAQAASNQLAEMINHPLSVPSLFNIITNSTTDTTLLYGLVFLRRALNRHLYGTDDEINAKIDQFMQFCPVFIQLLSRPMSFQNEDNLCECLFCFATKVNEYRQWPELVATLMAILQQGRHRLAMNLFVAIAGSYPYEVEQEIYHPFFELAIGSLGCQDAELRSLSLDVLEVILSDMFEINLTAEVPQLNQVLQSAAQVILQNDDAKECAKFFDALNGIYYSRFTDMTAQAPPFIQFVLSIINNQEIDPYVRLAAHQFLEPAPTTDELSEFFSQNYPNLLRATLSLAVEICGLDRDSNDYQFAYEYIGSLAYLADQNEVGGVFTQITSELVSASPQGVQVALMALSSLAESCPDCVCSEPDGFVQLAMTGLNQNDDLPIFNEAGQFLIALSNAGVPMGPYIDSIVPPLMNMLTQPIYVETLSKVLSATEQPPAEIFNLIMALNQILVNPACDFKDTVLDCLTSALKTIPIDERFFEALHPSLSSVVGEEGLLGPVFKVYTALGSVSPQSTQQKLGEFIGFLMQRITAQSDGSTMKTVADALNAFIEQFPQQMISIAGQLIPPLMSIVRATPVASQQTLDEDDNENLQEDTNYGENVIVSAHGSAMHCLSELLVSAAEAFGENYDTFVNMLAMSLQDIDQIEQGNAANALATATESLIRTGVDPVYLENILIKQIPHLTSENTAIEMFNALQQIISYYPAEICLAQNIDVKFMEIIKTGLLNKLAVQTAKINKKTVNDTVYPVMMMCFERFIVSAGQAMNKFPEIIDMLAPKLQVSMINVRGPAIAAGARLAIAMQNGPLLDLAIAQALAGIQQKNIGLRANSLRALTAVLNSVPEKMQPHCQMLVNGIAQMLANERESSIVVSAGAALFCSVFTKFQVETPWNQIDEILQKVPMSGSDDESMCFGLICKKASENGQNLKSTLKVGIRMFDEDYWNWKHFPQDLLTYIATTILAIEGWNEQAAQLLEMNQKQIAIVMRRLVKN